jgi:branched-chain amino acid transport system substrate-binding protein
MRRLAGICLVALSFGACGSEATGDDPVVRVYVSESLGGTGGGVGNTDLIRAEQLALEEAGGRAGRFRVELKLLDESSDEAAAPPAVTENARRAIDDPKAVALLGNSTSQWTVAALPITNRAGLLQVAPTATYVGLTGKGLDPDEPGRYRPAGKPNFARVIADDDVQAGALAQYLRRDGVRRVAVYDDGSLYGRGLHALLLERLRGTGITVVDSPRIRSQLTSPSGLGAALAAERVDALAYMGGVPGNVIRAFAEAAPGVKVFLGDQAFGLNVQDDLGDAEDIVRITAPAADTPQAVAFGKRFREKFGTTPDPQVLGGYESVNAVLAAIEAAGDRGDDREAVREAFFGLQREDSVFGPYRVTPEGRATIRRYGLYRVRDRKIVRAGTVTVR